MRAILVITYVLCINFGFSQTEEIAITTIQSNINKADQFYESKQKDSALYYINQALILAKKFDVDSLQINTLLSLSNIESNKQNALSHLINAKQIARKNKYFNLLAKTYFRIGEFHYKNDTNKLAFNNYIKLDSLSNKHHVNPFLLAMSKTRLAGLLFRASNWTDAGQFPQIEMHINQGLKICDSFNLKIPAAKLNLQKGVLNKFRKKYSDAITYYSKALELSKKNQDYVTLAVIYNDIGSLYHIMKQIDSAETNYLRAIEVNKMHTDTLNLALMNLQIANFYNMISRPEKGLTHLSIAENLYKKRTDIRRENLFKLNDVATNIYFSLGKLDSAFSKSKEANRLFVEMTKVKNEENITELEAKYDNANKRNEIKLLKAQNKLVEEQKQNQRNLLMAALCISLLVAGFLFFLYRNRQQTNKKLKELDIFKTNLFTNISHELRTPLTLISGPIEKHLQNPETPSNIKENLSLVQHNSDRLVNLVDQMTELAKIDSGQSQLKVSYGHLRTILQQQLAVFQFQAEQKQIILNHNLDVPKEAWFDSDVLQKITANLLTNSIKYATKDSIISIKSYVNTNMLEFSIGNKVDNLNEINLNKLFERFYQVNNSSKGIGIGLALVRELVNLHKGQISIEKANVSTIVFKVRLPISKDAYNQDEIVEMLSPKALESLSSNSEDTIKEDASVLLIVEDDPDVRTFIASIFKVNYQVIEAVNGTEGISKALELIPDLIISDIMMPETDGIALTKSLKADERTSHIPIILLTAKVSDANKLQGINVGADDYITKPFKNELLTAKVDKLIDLRKQLQLRFSQEIILRPSDIAVSSTEEQFLEKLQSVIDNELIDSTFTTEVFSQSLGMSRMQLHRKLKALTGQSTSEFIRTQRLKLAADMLKNSDTIVSQVGYAVGFNDHSYFTKCFKKQFGCTPTEFSNSK
ncbi:response regulator [uncultured Psychroserpens sp.]|uniref:response regulator n=1 Tax=uncultured Psychroserpens sp. TaxID=255436 RepID=UPI0026125879|nr:response regulator [uncultured Psychroserpens sp.]